MSDTCKFVLMDPLSLEHPAIVIEFITFLFSFYVHRPGEGRMRPGCAAHVGDLIWKGVLFTGIGFPRQG